MAADPRPVVYPPRSCAKVDGRPKVGFRSRRDANHTRKQGHVDQHAYLCRCGYWHLGHRGVA